MQKLLISLACGVALAVSGCSKPTEKREIVYRHSFLERLPFVYKMQVQQGNVFTQEMVNQLQPGISKRQARFLLGTPILVDVFHQDRWDFVYTNRRGRKPMQQQQLTLHFEDDALTRIEGDLRPNPAQAGIAEPTESLVEVPDYHGKKGILTRSLETVGLTPTE